MQSADAQTVYLDIEHQSCHYKTGPPRTFVLEDRYIVSPCLSTRNYLIPKLNPLLDILMKRISRVRVSRTTVISSASAVAKLVENVSEAVNFGPTKGAAKIVQQMLETIKEIDENEDARFMLIKRVVDFLLLIREHFDGSGTIISSNLSEKMQEFENVLLRMHEDLKVAEKRGFAGRMISREKIKSDLASHSAALDVAISKLNLSLLLGLTVTTQIALTCNSPRDRELSGNRMMYGALVSQNASTRYRDDEFLEYLRDEYEEVRICDVHLIPTADPARSSVVTFSNLSYAFIKGERRLIRSFDGEDERQREEWLKEVKHWHRLRHQNLLQMHGFSKKTSPHLYVVFQNAQARCLATYLLDAFDKSDVPSISKTIVKMFNDAASAIRHAAKQLHMNEAISVLVTKEATFALDSGDNLILSVSPLRPEGRGMNSLFGTLQTLLCPPMDSREVNRYFTRLKASSHSLSVPIISMGQTRAAVTTFFYNNYIAVEGENGVFLEPIAETSNHNQLVLSAYVDYDCEVKPGDYGILVPGQEEEFSIQACGNAGDGSPGFVDTVNSSTLWNRMTGKWVGIVQGSPRVWGLDLNDAHMRGYSGVDVSWDYVQGLTDVPRAVQYFANSTPLLQHADSSGDLVLITRVTDYKDYRFSLHEMASCEPQFEDAPQTSIEASRPLPVVYVSEPDSENDELQISSCHPQFCPSMGDHWDPRVGYEGKFRQRKLVHYIRLRKEDIVR